MASVDDLERRVVALESRVRATEVDMATLNEKLNRIIGGQDVMLGILRGHGEALSGQSHALENHSQILNSHDAKLDSHNAKLDSIVNWIQAQPAAARRLSPAFTHRIGASDAGVGTFRL